MQDTDQELEALEAKASALDDECRFRSMLQVEKERAQLARSSHRLVHYVLSLRMQANASLEMLEPNVARSAAVEWALLLQDEEQARRVQSDVNEGEYEWLCDQTTTCAFDHLAESTGQMCGYNSSGMHHCIEEGLQICRQTGRLQCVNCFRIYATQVYGASDDLEMARLQCQAVIDGHVSRENSDWEWNALEKLAWTNLLEGRFGSAQASVTDALEKIKSKPPTQWQRAAWVCLATLNALQILRGKPLRTFESFKIDLKPLPVGEWRRLDLMNDCNVALQSAMTGELDHADSLLTRWDRELLELQALHEWFDVRLRRIAVHRLRGDDSSAEHLCRGLEARAHEAQDYLTLRRLARLRDSAITPCPIPLLAEPDVVVKIGETSIGQDLIHQAPAEPSPPEAAIDEEPKEPSDQVAEETPLAGELRTVMEEILASDGRAAELERIRERILAFHPESVANSHDAAYLVHLSRFTVDTTQDAEQVWPWAESMLSRFAEDGTLLNVVAALGHHFRAADDVTFGTRIPLERIERWFRRSLTLEPNQPQNFARAGEFFFDQGERGEAERCLARAFRLDRANGTAARELAEIYLETDRPRDALSVLDLALREGCEDPQVAWQAGMVALQLEQHASLLTYLDRYTELAGDREWLHYYRALGLFELGRLEECLAELDQEQSGNPPGLLHVHVVRTSAFEKLKQHDAAREELGQVLAIRLGDVDYISLAGLVRLAEELCEVVQDWPDDDALKQRLIRRLLRTGLLPDAYFDRLRARNPESNDIRFFRVRLRQRLDASWPASEGCLSGQESWNDYLIDWGVLAETEGEAVDRVLEWQCRCESVRPEVEEAEGSDEYFRDRPGVVWQGYRRCEATEGQARQP